MGFNVISSQNRFPQRLAIVVFIFAIVFTNRLWAKDSSQEKITAACVRKQLNPSLQFGPTSPELEVIKSNHGNLFKIKKVSPEETERLNDDALRSLGSVPEPSNLGPRRAVFFSESEIQNLFQNVVTNSQVSAALCGKYRGSEQRGFCWARVFAIHLMAIRAGAGNQNVKKIWALGTLKSGKDLWRYHVATVVRGPDNQWFAVDPIFKTHLPVEEWYKKMKSQYDADGRMRIYITEGTRFGPEYTARPDKARLKMNYYGFFIDFLDQFHLDIHGVRGPWGAAKDAQERALIKLQVMKWLFGITLTGAVAEDIYQRFLSGSSNSSDSSKPDAHH